MVESAGFLSFSFLPSCSQELTLGGSRCLTELLLCNALCCPGAPQSWEGQKAWHHLHLLINAQQQKLLGTGPVPSHPSPELALSVNVCWLAYKSRASVCSVTPEGNGKPANRQGSSLCVGGGGGGAFTSAALNAQVKKRPHR